MPRSTKRRTSNMPQTKQPQQRQSTQPQPMPGSSFGDAVKGGIGMGLGIEAVRGAIGAFSNNNSEPQPQSQSQHQSQNHPCDDLKNLLIKCDDSKNCEVYLKAYQSCMHENKI